MKVTTMTLEIRSTDDPEQESLLYYITSSIERDDRFKVVSIKVEEEKK